VPLEKLEPLYRYLATCDGKDPMEAMMRDMEALAKDGYISNGEKLGVHRIVKNGTISKEVQEALRRQIGSENPVFFHCMFQAIDNEMTISVSRISSNSSKTSLALHIAEDDSVIVDYAEPDAIFHGGLIGQTIYNSISTLVVGDDGSKNRGFLRAETTFRAMHRNMETICIKVDFRLSRTKPFFIKVMNLQTLTPTATMGAACETLYDQMGENPWTA